MAKITQLPNVLPDIKKVCQTIGPQILANRYPANPDGTPKETLTNDETKEVFENITREFWRQQIEAVKVAEATETTRRRTVDSISNDPFA